MNIITAITLGVPIGVVSMIVILVGVMIISFIRVQVSEWLASRKGKKTPA